MRRSIQTQAALLRQSRPVGGSRTAVTAATLSWTAAGGTSAWCGRRSADIRPTSAPRPLTAPTVASTWPSTGGGASAGGAVATSACRGWWWTRRPVRESTPTTCASSTAVWTTTAPRVGIRLFARCSLALNDNVMKRMSVTLVCLSDDYSRLSYPAGASCVGSGRFWAYSHSEVREFAPPPPVFALFGPYTTTTTI